MLSEQFSGIRCNDVGIDQSMRATQPIVARFERALWQSDFEQAIAHYPNPIEPYQDESFSHPLVY